MFFSFCFLWGSLPSSPSCKFWEHFDFRVIRAFCQLIAYFFHMFTFMSVLVRLHTSYYYAYYLPVRQSNEVTAHDLVQFNFEGVKALDQGTCV